MAFQLRRRRGHPPKSVAEQRHERLSKQVQVARNLDVHRANLHPGVARGGTVELLLEAARPPEPREEAGRV
eukprot:6145110-Alexandrium_andersonii.AAC.1